VVSALDWHRLLPLVFVGSLVELSGCARGKDPGAADSGRAAGVDSEAVARAWCPADLAEVDAWVAVTLDAMTTSEKVAQMSGLNGIANEYGRYDGVEDTRNQIPAFRMMDGPRGAHRASGPATAFPVGIARGATWSPLLEEQVATAIAREVKAVGVNVLLAPTINVLRHPRWGRSQETYGEDPHHLGVLGGAFVQGAQAHVLAQPKHFAVNSIEDTRFDVDVRIDDASLHEVYLPHFHDALIDAGAATVMAAYNHVNGPPAAESPQLLTDVLREQWAFPGVVVSDWIFATETTHGAAEAGLDIEMPVPKVYGDALEEALADGTVEPQLVDDAVRRILRTKACFGLELGEPAVQPELRLTDAHLDLAQQVAERSAVLLKNDDLLPILSGASVAVTGRLADVENIGDGGSSAVLPPDVVTVWEGLRDEADGRTVGQVAADDVTALAAADVVVVVVGLTEEDEGEGLIAAGDRTSLTLSDEDIATIQSVAAVQSDVVVVLMGGGAITVEAWLDDVEAVLMGWYPGMRGGTALARVLYGAVPPAGRLPLTVPVQESDLPDFDNVDLTVQYDGFHGYRHLERTGTAARFPFGFGLSTTTFEVGAPRLTAEPLSVSVSLVNTGVRSGYETIQVYGGPVEVEATRARRKLLGFQQVYLEPGEREEVTVALDALDLAVYESDGWNVRPGAYTLDVAVSAEAVLYSLPLEL